MASTSGARAASRLLAALRFMCAWVRFAKCRILSLTCELLDGRCFFFNEIAGFVR